MQNRSILERYRIQYAQIPFSEQMPVAPAEMGRYRPGSRKIEELHYHNGLELGYCFSGSGLFMIDGEILPFQAPCATLIYENQVHKAQSSPREPSEWSFVSVEPRLLLKELDAGKLSSLLSGTGRSGSAGLILPGAGSALCGLVLAVIRELEEKKEGYLDGIRGLIWAILVMHKRMIGESGGDPGEKRRFMAEIGPAANYISSNYREQVCMKDLAEAARMSEATLRRRFHDAFGMSPLDYLHKVRTNAAAALLLDPSLTVLEICYLTGYNTQSSFNRQFRKFFRRSPTEWRTEATEKGRKP